MAVEGTLPRSTLIQPVQTSPAERTAIAADSGPHRWPRNWLAAAVVAVLLGFGCLPPATAQYTLLQTFHGTTADGGNPVGGLVVAGSSLYGTTRTGGSSNGGVLFAINPTGTGFTVLHNFGALTGDGSRPVGGATLAGSALYGMTQSGGSAGFGVVYKINTDGSGYSILHNFTAGAPVGELTLAGTTLYGVTGGGGSSGLGTFFKINPDGSGFAILYNFTDSSPIGAVTPVGSTFYGLASGGGRLGLGVIYKVNGSGSGYTVLDSFDAGSPVGSLILAGGVLYGTQSGGSHNAGGIFKINPAGPGLTSLYDFNGTDGAFPAAGLTLAGANLYGMTSAGGSNGDGVLFRIDPASEDFAILHNFSGTDGADPAGIPAVVGPVLYGMTTAGGGPGGFGVVFSLPVEDPCSDSIAPLSATLGIGAGTGTVIVTAGPACSWTALSPVSWITITSGASGTGTGTVDYAVSASTNSRSAILTIAGQPFPITQTSPTAPIINTASGLTAGQVGTAYQATLVASGGVMPYAWAITAGAMPAGLVLDPSTGTISGTPTTIETSNWTVRVTGNDGLYSEKAFRLTIHGSSPRITTPSLLPAGGLAVTYRQALLATGGSPPYSWAVNSAKLPPGINLTSHLLSGTPTAAGSYYFGIRCTDSNGLYQLRQFQMSISANGRVSAPALLPAGGTFTNSVKVTLSCATAGATIHYTIDGTEPTAASPIYQKKSLAITNSVMLKAKATKANLIDSTTTTATIIVIIPLPPAIATTTLKDARVKQSYAVTLQLKPATGFPPTKWSWTPASGAKLPPGLTLNAATGVISGKPTQAGTYSFTVKGIDSLKKFGTQALTLTVN